MIKVERCWLHPASSHLHHVSTLMYMFCPNLCTRMQTHAASHCGRLDALVPSWPDPSGLISAFSDHGRNSSERCLYGLFR